MIVELAANPEPFTVRVKAGPPTCPAAGLMLLMVGFTTGATIAKVELLETAPFPLTVTATDPCVAMRLAATAPVNCAALPKVVGRADPFHMIVELAANPEPFTVRVNAAPPACALAGTTPLMVGLSVAATIVNVTLLDVAPLVLTTIAADPWVAMRLAVTAPVNWFELTKDVDRGVPSQEILELAANPAPFTVSRNPAPPACALAGMRLLIVEVAIVNVELLDTVPLVLTVTAADPCIAIRLAATSPVS